MSLRINNSNISRIVINGSNIQMCKINGKIVFQLNDATITLTFTDKTITALSDKPGSYDFYYADNSGIIEDYDKIVSFDLTANTTKTYTYLNSFNIAPNNATKIVVCKSGTTNIVSSSSLPSQFIFNESSYGDKLYSFGALSDVHIDGDGTDENSAANDFSRALRFFNSYASLVGISGDLSRENGYNELSLFKNIVDSNATIPVYASRGNHDCRYSISDFETYTGGGLYFERTYNNDVFLFLGMNEENYGDACFTTEELTWLETKLENYKNQRVFLFFHVFMPNTCGNINNLYPWDGLNSSSSNVSKFLSLMTKYKNVVYFSGHSHLEFNCQKFGDHANIFSNGTTCHRVHIPSCAYPRKNDNGTDSSNTYDNNEGSEGYLVDVYENCIVLKGIDFTKNKFLPIANYLLDTTITEIIDINLFDYSTATILNAAISRSQRKVSSPSYNDKTTYISIESNTTYKVTKTSGSRFVIATCSTEPTVGTSVTDYVDNYTGTELTITSGSNDKYLVIYYHSNEDSITEEMMRQSIVVTKV